ncbi:hypothetical protein [Pseudobacteriovorax antillogorgiicola]|uniref:HAMP domain-containing protein n=1 Tax=Pseudobacteriovorax antillogorgiicola TaxID=1513793 RepID=A0A1Y6BDZ9_9BACT|nr:hypothetical protein [Pseudobacteriovorax antillogorgiicola]TCS56357.1 hypothetical protein EDD56_104179 [Pseudobacteriovorax antillogorgiicola]SMF06697.1 hypothetical protein SAMN06296036_104154 [Pseudobacteriovorax antillogorgiicola]
MSRRRYKRKFSNYLLQPLLQVKLGLYAIVLALIFCLVMVWLFYANFYRFYDLVLELTDLREEVTSILDAYINEMVVWTLVATGIYFFVTVAMSIFYTHRLIGPTYAFRRHIQELSKGNYKSRVLLRKADAFAEVAEDLNQLATQLETNSQRRGNGD